MKRTVTAIAPRVLAGMLLVGAASAVPLESQYRPTSESRAPALRVPSTPGLARGAYVVVVDLDANRLYFTRNLQVLWSAPVGTGTGLRLEHEENAWDFSTPNGVFAVQHKAENPDWIAPDWYFVENNLPIPSADSPKRRFPGGLGAAAVYIGKGLAIHGTDKPDLLGQRVSHGCIRISNQDARRLFHNVQMGTEVVIVGGRDAAAVPAARKAPPAPRNGGRAAATAPQKDPYLELLASLSTDQLLEALDEELATRRETRWPEVAGALLERALDWEDGEAVEGLFLRAVDTEGLVAEEFATFLADAYVRAPGATLRALGNLDSADQRRAASAIVDAALGLYPGDPSSRVAPWPTRRIPRDGLGRSAREGWDALAAAERAYQSPPRSGRTAT